MSFRKNKVRKASILCLTAYLLGSPELVKAQVPCGGYEVTAIVSMEKCPPFGVPPVVPLGLNEQGWMVGYFNPCVIGANRAWLWTPEDGLVVIPTPAGTSYSRAVAISGSLIVGEYDNSELELGRTGFLYNYETDEFSSLGTLPGGNTSKASGINSKGDITGFWGDVVNDPFPLAFIWRDGAMIDISSDFVTSRSAPRDINSNGLVTGWMGQAPTIDSRAFIWNEGKVTELPQLPGGITSEGKAINNQRDVAGRGWFFDSELDAFVWRAFAFIDGKAINLGTISGFDKSLATDINDDQIIVGFSQTTSCRAFIWRDGEMTALNDLISPSENFDICSASGINEAGQIACSAIDQFNDNVAVLLTPIEAQLGDLDNDCQVSVSDLLVLLSLWGLCPECKECPADLNQDCTVGVSDLLILLANWG